MGTNYWNCVLAWQQCQVEENPVGWDLLLAVLPPSIPSPASARCSCLSLHHWASSLPFVIQQLQDPRCFPCLEAAFQATKHFHLFPPARVDHCFVSYKEMTHNAQSAPQEVLPLTSAGILEHLPRLPVSSHTQASHSPFFFFLYCCYCTWHRHLYQAVFVIATYVFLNGWS